MPPRNPERVPSAVETTIEKQAAARPMITEIRAPKMIRLRTSLPNWSTPMGCCHELGLNLSPAPISLNP